MMMPLLITAYFLGTCALAAILLWPGLRITASQRIRSVAQRLTWSSRPALAAQREPHGAGPKRLILLALALVLLAAPVLVAWYGGRGQHLPGFDQAERLESDVVTALLRGEHLVPPPALPPDVFMTPEIQAHSPQLVRADRRWEPLHPEFRQRLLWVYRVMKEQHGYDMVLVEGYRSPQRQDLLSQQGPQVTLARAWQSYHQYGLAADSAFMRDGKLVISERDPWARKGYELYGQVAVELGLVWGGRWQNADLTHVELRTAQQRGKGPTNP
jgi:peptidoglycan LD-endopeptidase CwlK